MVTLWANTISSNGNLPKEIATTQPNIITREIKIFTFLEFKLLPNPNASPSNAPPTVALPTKEEKAAPNNPTKNSELACLPNNGSNALPISAALPTCMPLGNNTAAAQIITAALLNTKISTTVNDPLSNFYIFNNIIMINL